MGNTIQHTVTHCQHTATHVQCNALQRPATPGNALQHTGFFGIPAGGGPHNTTHGKTQQHAATRYNMLQYTAIHCNTLQYTATHCNTLQHTTKFNVLQLATSHSTFWNTHLYATARDVHKTATHSHALQHTATHYVVQRTATHCKILNILDHTFICGSS